MAGFCTSKTFHPDGRQLHGVLLADLTATNETQIILAESAQLIGDGINGRYEFMLLNGSTHAVPRLEPDLYTSSRFISRSLPVPLATSASTVNSGETNPFARPSNELWTKVRNKTATLTEQVELHRRLALPFACLAFVLIGFPLGLSTRRGGRSTGLVISALLMLLYYMFFIGGTRIAGNAQMSPFIGTWGANLSFSIFGIILLIRGRT